LPRRSRKSTGTSRTTMPGSTDHTPRRLEMRVAAGRSLPYSREN
jgi:hypothetical protein